MTPNLFAYVALILWMPLSIAVFATRPAPRAAFGLLIGAVLLLPQKVAFDPPLVPALDKLSIASFWVLLGSLFWAPKTLAAAKPGRGVDLLFVLLVIGNVLTVLANPDKIVVGPVEMPGLTLHDAVSDTLRDLFLIGIPFFIGRAYFRSSVQLDFLFKGLAVAGLLYSIPILAEVRLAPQLHIWIYGFFQHDWQQMKRWGGFRPIVFMTHGLSLAMFVFITTAATAHIARIRQRLLPVPSVVLALYMFVVLVLCHSTGALIYGLILLPIVWIFSARNQARTAIVLALIVMTFPMTRLTDTFPTKALVEWAGDINEERAASLEFRFHNEDQLLVRAFERPLFGWGGYGRIRIRDPKTGKDLSVTDGEWIIEVGERGIVGFFAIFGLMLLPVFKAARRLKYVPSRRDQLGLATLALLVAVSAIEWLPNGRYNYIPFLLAGALHGLATGLSVPARRRLRA